MRLAVTQQSTSLAGSISRGAAKSDWIQGKAASVRTVLWISWNVDNREKYESSPQLSVGVPIEREIRSSVMKKGHQCQLLAGQTTEILLIFQILPKYLGFQMQGS